MNAISPSIVTSEQIPAAAVNATALTPVKKVTLQEWQEFLTKILTTDFSQRLHELKSYCDCLDAAAGKYGLKIVTSAETLTFVIDQDIYYSQAIIATAFEGRKQKNTPRTLYEYFTIYEGEDLKTKLLVIRSDLQGEYGEVCNIFKGKHLSGTDIKIQFCLPLLDALQIETVFKHDDARRKAKDCRKEIDLLFRLILPIVSQAGTKEEGSTYYSKHKFVPLYCKFLLYPTKEHQATQDPKFYYSAVEHVRETKLQHLHDDAFANSPEDQEIIARLFQQYCSKVVLDETPDFKDHTVTDLGQAIFKIAAAKDEKSEKVKRANRDLLCFYQSCLYARFLPKTSTPEQRLYNLAQSVILRHYLWVRHYKNPREDVTYQQFKAASHPSFKNLVANSKIKLTPSVCWDKLAHCVFKGVSDTTFSNTSKNLEVKQLDLAEFVSELQKIQQNGIPDSPVKAINALAAVCTKASFADNSTEKYWQLWLEIPQGKKKSYLELEIFEHGTDYELVLKDASAEVFTLRVCEQVIITHSPQTEGDTAVIAQEILKLLQKAY